MFAFGIDAARQNARKIYLIAKKEKITYCAFRRNIVQSYLGMYKTPPYKSAACGSSSSSRVHALMRTNKQTEEHNREKCNQARALSATTKPGFSAKSAKFCCTLAAGIPFTTSRQNQRTTLLHV